MCIYTFMYAYIYMYTFVNVCIQVEEEAYTLIKRSRAGNEGGVPLILMTYRPHAPSPVAS